MNEALFEEASASARVAGVPLAHLSIELGHLYMEDFVAGPQRLRRLMANVAPWVRAVETLCASQLEPVTPRISTCFLVDDYFTQLISPRELIPQIVEAVSAAGLRLDYLARESACVEADGVNLAMLVQDRLVQEPPPNTNGSRPPTSTTGWLCNGEPSPHEGPSEAMRRKQWQPPSENGANRHSIFLDVQLWQETAEGRLWSCAYLAGVWQLLRLGVLRHNGAPVAQPRPWEGEFPASWGELPPITRLTAQPAAFSAYRTFSVLPIRFLGIESAVRMILGQVDVAQAIRTQLAERAAREQAPMALAPEIVDRMEYAFAVEAWR